MNKLLSVSRPSIGDGELRAVGEVFTTGWLGMGKWVTEFEDRLKNFLGAKNVIAINTGTTALHLALDGAGIKKSDEVIVPSLTFAGTIQAIMASGARPVFCDVREDTLNIDINDVRRRITSKTKAILPVHYTGLPCEMDELLRVAEKHGLRLIEDAAHAFGSRYKGRKIGSFGDITCFSFDPIKNITCGEGGAIVTDDSKLAKVLYKKRVLGISKDRWSRSEFKKSWFYTVDTMGYRYHMSNINAAIGIIQLAKLEKFIQHKNGIAKQYDAEFKGIDGIKFLYRDYENTAPFMYVIKVRKDRDRLIGFLKKNNIEAGVNYIPNHLQPFFSVYRTKLPVTEKVWKQILSLPFYVDMTEENVGLVAGKVKEFFNK